MILAGLVGLVGCKGGKGGGSNTGTGPETYNVTVNSFLADGGDNFTVLRDGTSRLGGAVDTDAFEGYFAAFSPVAPYGIKD